MSKREKKPIEELRQPSLDLPWIDLRLKKEGMDYLWDSINNKQDKQEDARWDLAGNISKSKFIQDKDNWFYENILKEMAEYVYYKDWSNYYNVVVTKSRPPQIFELRKMWVNYQKQYEFNPPHTHAGLFSFVVFMKIPTHWKEQHALPWLEGVKDKQASNFMFIIGKEFGQIQSHGFQLSPEDEGRMLFFPTWLTHQVLPFYGTEKERITVSGNIFFPPPEDSRMRAKQLHEAY